MIKEENQQEATQQVCTTILNLFRILSIYLKPVIPHTIKKVEEFLNIPELSWQDLRTILLGHTINPFTPLLQRIEDDQVASLLKK
jgi:methionyl-tRNA synthetase